MRRPTDRSNLRRKAEVAYREYRVLMILAGWLTGQDRGQIDKSLAILPQLPRKRLQAEYSKLRLEIAELRRRLGAKASLAEYERLLKTHGEEAYGERGSTLLFVPKWMLEQHYFSHYERAFPLFTSLPPHARIGIDVEGIRRSVRPEITWHLLEAKLFEDMALLWNSTLGASASSQSCPHPPHAWKWLEALVRAAGRSAFYLVEGYLNGLAFDVLIMAQPGDLSDEEITKLREWDTKGNRPRLLSLRDKLLQYPRIAAGQQNPIIQESNCPEMKLIIEYEGHIRHALVHPTPKIEEWKETDLRESVFFVLSPDEVGKIVDASIALIRKVSEVTSGKFGDVDVWLFSRGSDGKFPEKAFT